LFSREALGATEHFTFGFRGAQSSMGPFANKITLKLCESSEHSENKIAYCAGQFKAFQGDAMDFNAILPQDSNGRLDIDSVTTKPVEFRHYESITVLHPVQELLKTGPLLSWNFARDVFGYDTLLFDGETLAADLIELAFSSLVRAAYTAVRKSPAHGIILFKIDVH
jgi:hypothetical protein